MSFASFLEAYMRNLVNAERAAEGLAPLTFEWNLGRAADAHALWMSDNDRFSHTGAGGSTPGERIAASGYDLQGATATGENLAARTYDDDGGFRDEVDLMHAALMDSPGHRANILNPDYTHIGIGIVAGTLSYESGSERPSLLVTQKFGATDGTPDEDLLGTNTHDIVTASFGDDAIRGFGGDDLLRAGHGNDSVNAGLGNDSLFGGDGHDLMHGLAGQDLLMGEDGRDRLVGGRGDDTIDGGTGHDRLFGGTEQDLISGGRGNDTILGQGGFDTIDGGTGDDVMRGGFNADTFVFAGEFGNDRIADFEQDNRFERIDLSAVAGIDDYDDLAAHHLSQADGYALIDDGNGNTIRLDDVTLAGLSAEDFVF